MTQSITILDGIPELGILVKSNNALVSSKVLAKVFEKDHKHVLDEIRKTMENLTAEYVAVNFKKKSYKIRGKSYPMYLLTRKSFSLIAMGFTGKKALKFKVDYIDAFESMTSMIQTRLISKGGYRIMTSAIAKHIENNPKTFSKEADMLNNIILGMPANVFKELNGVVNGQTRGAVAQDMLNKLDEAQRLNTHLIKSLLSFEERKNIIEKSFKG